MKRFVKIVSAFVFFGIASSVIYRVTGSTVCSKTSATQARVDMIAAIINTDVAGIRKQKIERGVSTLDAIGALDLVRMSSLIDDWGNPLHIDCVDIQCSAIAVRSVGENGVDEFGRGDDVVSRDVGITSVRE